jgi:hypothetical protein
MRSVTVAIFLLVSWCAPAAAAVSVNIGINLPLYPNLVPVPGYPVYYAPDLDSNYFFYDGNYWVYAQDGWYSSPWYDGPWDLVDPQLVPLICAASAGALLPAPAIFLWRLDGRCSAALGRALGA